MEEIFKKYYSLPLELDKYTKRKVWTKDDDMAFDFEMETPTNLAEEIVNKLNNKKSEIVLSNLRYNDGYIYHNDSKLLFIRSWGRLIGQGASGLGLSQQEAINIQDSFGNWIIKKLSK